MKRLLWLLVLLPGLAFAQGGGVSALAFNVVNPASGQVLTYNGKVWVNGSAGSGTLPSCTTDQLVYYAANGSAVVCLTLGTNLSITGGVLNATGSGGGVSSFTGDGSLISNSASTGGVTVTLANTGVGYGVWGNIGSSTGAPGYHALSTYPTVAFPTLNQNTTGTAANLSGTPALPNGTTATTQTTGDNTTKIATDAFVLANATSAGVSSLTAGSGISVSASTGAVTVSTSQGYRTVSTASDTISCTTDSGKFITYSDSAAVAISVPQATSSCGSGFGFTVQNTSSSGVDTFTPTTSTINGAATLIVPAGLGCSIVSDGTNYQVGSCTALPAPVQAAASGTTFTPVCVGGKPTTVNTIVATGNLTINLPTGCADGQGVKLRIKFTASITYTFNAGYHAGTTTGITALPTASSSTSGEDYLDFDDDSANSRFNYLAIASF